MLSGKKPILLIASDSPGRALYEDLLNVTSQEIPPVVELAIALNFDGDLDLVAAFKKHNPCCCLIVCSCLIDSLSSPKNIIENIRKIRLEYSAENLPIIVLADSNDEGLVIELLQSGAQDYLKKSEVNSARLINAIRNALQTANLQKQLTMLAHYDALTGLLNRSLLINRLGQTIHRCNRYNQKCAILHLDIDKFKSLNEVHGQEFGDAVLQEVADRIRKNCRATDSPARLGSDEFAILLEEVHPDMCAKVAQKLIDSVEQPMLINGLSQKVKISIGISVYPDTANNGDELLKQADEALQRARRHDSLKFVSFSEKYKRQWTRQQVLERDLPSAIANGNLALVFQPIVSVQGYHLKRIEALSRWPRLDYDVYAMELIEMIDRLGLADSFHDWLFNESFAQARKLADDHVVADLCLNIPANYCYSRSISRAIEQSLMRHQVDPRRVELEITESTLMLYPDRSVQLLNELHDKGLRIAVDDFGTGYSSMSYLTKLPLDTLKIDKHFFLDNARDDRNRKVIGAVTALGHSLGLEIIAEGVETEAELNLASQVGCDLLQGFYFGKPAPIGNGWADFFQRFPLINAAP